MPHMEYSTFTNVGAGWFDCSLHCIISHLNSSMNVAADAEGVH